MVAFIDAHRATYGVEPICRVLPIAPSTYNLAKAREHDPSRRSARARRETTLRTTIRTVWDDNRRVYGVRKVWHQLTRDGEVVARCTVARLVQRQLVATRPNQLWVADLMYVRTWAGFVYVAFVIDVFARVIVGWHAARSLTSELALHALEQALYDRDADRDAARALVHHSDRGVQYLSIRYTERLAEAKIAASVGSRGDSYDNAMAETVIGLYKTE
jgi:transposase InsO family protein